MIKASAPTTSRWSVAGSRALAMRSSAAARSIRKPDSCMPVREKMIGRCSMAFSRWLSGSAGSGPRDDPGARSVSTPRTGSRKTVLHRLIRHPLGLVILLAVGARAAVMVRGSGTFDDPDNYRPLAQTLAAGEGFAHKGRPTAYRPPLYPVLLAPILWALGDRADWGIALLHLGRRQRLGLVRWPRRGGGAGGRVRSGPDLAEPVGHDRDPRGLPGRRQPRRPVPRGMVGPGLGRSGVGPGWPVPAQSPGGRRPDGPGRTGGPAGHRARPPGAERVAGHHCRPGPLALDGPKPLGLRRAGLDHDSRRLHPGAGEQPGVLPGGPQRAAGPDLDRPRPVVLVGLRQPGDGGNVRAPGRPRLEGDGLAPGPGTPARVLPGLVGASRSFLGGGSGRCGVLPIVAVGHPRLDSAAVDRPGPGAGASLALAMAANRRTPAGDRPDAGPRGLLDRSADACPHCAGNRPDRRRGAAAQGPPPARRRRGLDETDKTEVARVGNWWKLSEVGTEVRRPSGPNPRLSSGASGSHQKTDRSLLGFWPGPPINHACVRASIDASAARRPSARRLEPALCDRPGGRSAASVSRVVSPDRKS